jgi:hypothetical protein
VGKSIDFPAGICWALFETNNEILVGSAGFSLCTEAFVAAGADDFGELFPSAAQAVKLASMAAPHSSAIPLVATLTLI